MSLTEQRTLPIALNDEATFANYFPGPNNNWLTYLQDFTSGAKDWFLYLWGEHGAGCSHLLQACCHACLQQQQTAVYINFQLQLAWQPRVLDNLEQMHLVCLDNIQSLLGQEEWEESLFHFYNRMLERGALLLVSADVAPQHLPIQLADLASRLLAGVCGFLHNLSDDDKLAALQFRAQRRGLQLTTEVGQFLLRRYPRDMTALFAVFEQLDQASLIAKRKLTIPFVKQVLAI